MCQLLVCMPWWTLTRAHLYGTQMKVCYSRKAGGGSCCCIGVLPLRWRAGAGDYQLLSLGPEGHTTPRFAWQVLACLRSSNHHLQGCSGQPWPGQSLLGGREQPLECPFQSGCLWQCSLDSVSQHTIAVSVSWLVRRHRTHFIQGKMTTACTAGCRRTGGKCQLTGFWTRRPHAGAAQRLWPQALAQRCWSKDFTTCVFRS